MKKLKVGDTYRQWQVPASAVRTSGDQMAVVIDPDSVPDAYVSRIGLVTFDVNVLDRERSAGATTTTSLRRVTVDGDLAWAESMTSVSNAETRATGTYGAPVVTSTQLGSSATRANLAESMRATLPRLRTTMRPSGPIDTSARIASETCNVEAKSRRWATVGTSYPIGAGHTSWLDYSSSTSSTFGVATKGMGPGSSWGEDGSKTIGDSWGADYKPTKWKRSYRIGVRYYKFHCSGITGWHQWRWKPNHNTGDADANSLKDYPNWRTCAFVRGGVKWSRGDERGRDYTLSTGVTIAALIGFDLTARRAYQTTGKLYYYHNTEGRKICGKDDDPARASKMRARWPGWTP